MKYVEINRCLIRNAYVQNAHLYKCTNLQIDDFYEDLIVISKLIEQKNLDYLICLDSDIYEYLKIHLKEDIKLVFYPEKIKPLSVDNWLKKAIRIIHKECFFCYDKAFIKNSISLFVKDYAISYNYFRRLCEQVLENDETDVFLKMVDEY